MAQWVKAATPPPESGVLMFLVEESGKQSVVILLAGTTKYPENATHWRRMSPPLPPSSGKKA